MKKEIMKVFNAITNNDFDAFKKLLDNKGKKCSPNEFNDWISHEYHVKVSKLAELHHISDKKYYFSFTGYSSYMNRYNMVEHLLKMKPQVKYGTAIFNCLEFNAVMNHNPQMLDILTMNNVARMGSPPWVDFTDNTPLSRCIFIRHVPNSYSRSSSSNLKRCKDIFNIVKVIVDTKKNDPNIGMPLHKLCNNPDCLMSGNFALIEWLVKNGYNKYARDENNDTLVDIISRNIGAYHESIDKMKALKWIHDEKNHDK